MFKIYLADINYNIIAPLDIYGGGINSISFVHEINQSRELKIVCNTNLDEVYDFLILQEACLVLEFKNYKIGFSKLNNTITHLLPYGNIGNGSDFSTAIRLDNYSQYDPDYPVIPETLSDSAGQSASYIFNTYNDNQRDNYKIKPFNFSNNVDASSQNQQESQIRLYNEAVNFLVESQPNRSIDGQIRRQNGVLELKFYSSSYDLNNNRRTITLNQDYNGSCSGLAFQMNNSAFNFIIYNDINITLNTGMYSNYELLNEICKNRSLSWREIGIVDGKTNIAIGNFDKLLPTAYATNEYIDDIFDSNNIQIVSVTEYYPSVKVELEIKDFILEGENIMVDYTEYQEDIKGNKKEIFNIKKTQNYKGGSIELYNLK